MLFVTRWFYKNIAGLEVESGGLTCAVCGLPMAEGIPLEKVIRWKTFNDLHKLACFDRFDEPAFAELFACPACEWYFENQQLRFSHWYVTPDEARVLAREDIVPLILELLETPPGSDFYLLLSRTKKKHVALRGRLNAAGCLSLRINFEEYLVDVDHQVLGLFSNVITLRQYHGWDEIESDAYLPFAILRWPSFGDFERTREAVRPWLNTPQYELARYLYSPKLREDGLL